MEFGKIISKLRAEKELNQRELASLLGVSSGAIGMWETGKRQPDLDTVKKIADVFNVSIDYLLGRTDNRNSIDNLEWRFPPVSNRLGTILKKYKEEAGISAKTFSEKLGINESVYNKLESSGYSEKYKLPYKLIQQISDVTGYDIDYVLGASDRTVIPSDNNIELNGILYPVTYIESNVHFKTKFEELCIENEIQTENVEKTLGITKESFTDIRWNRMPTLSELLRIAYSFGVSMDYLIGKTDIRMATLDDDELALILDYRDCPSIYKENIKKRAHDLSIDAISQRNGQSVAADQPLKKTGTDNLGK